MGRRISVATYVGELNTVHPEGNLKDTSSECLWCTEEWPYFLTRVFQVRETGHLATNLS